MAKLEVKHLTISFNTMNGAVRAVRDVSFDLQEGETLAIAGESGSGKSVTTRAVMGILAGNAVVDDGEIIYDGKDLLKIPEEEFHNLRGHKLAMVFQDPLSALNPIMRIGRQLTEAMLLNNKERRRDGRERFNAMLRSLESNMLADAEEKHAGDHEKQVIKEKISLFDSFVKIAVADEYHYKEATEACVEVLDGIEETEEALIRRRDSEVRETCGRAASALKKVYDPYTFQEGDAQIAAFHASLKEIGSHYDARRQGELEALFETIRAAMNEVIEGDTPNFFCIGYSKKQGKSVLTGRENIPEVNKTARRVLDEEFMLDFRARVEEALKYSEKESLLKKKNAVQELENALKVFEEAHLDQGRCREALKKAADAVDASIDPLQLDKDSSAYVYRSSGVASLERYFKSLKQNPKEEARFARETKKHDQEAAKGKNPPSVVPKNLIDTERARQSLINATRELIAHYEDQIRTGAAGHYSERALAIIDYMKERAEDYAFRLSMGMARHRAVELMKEVGIPEPHKRYHQYPFEFSGGMRQRIVIAIALSANPDILICDEPTTALDVTIQAQILELINRLKKERRLSVIFITHDLGVVANMADKIAIMYAGKIVEYGTADDVFYDPRHPYTWALLSSMPDLETREKLEAIPGTPPDMILPPKGDAFAARNKFAMQIDLEEQPPEFKITDTHWASTWLLHPDAPKVEPPAIVTERIRRMLKMQGANAAQAKGGAAE